MATIVRFAKYSIPKFVPKKYMNYDSSLLRRTFDSYKRNFCSQGVVDSFTDYDNEVSTYDNSKPSRRTPISANNNFSDFSATESSDNSVLKLQDGNHKYKYFAAYLLAKKLGEVESPESFVSPLDKKNGKVNDNLVKIPLACLHFNNGQFPNERSLVNWIKAIDFGLEQKYITSFGLSIAIWAFAKIVGKPSNSDKKLLSVVGFDRLTTWSIYNCVVAADTLAKHHAFRKWNLRSLYGLLNYSLSIYITQRLKYVESLNVDEKFQKFTADILRLIICIEVGLHQPCLLEEETKEEVVNLAVQCFRYYAQLMDESESISVRKKIILK
uniref:Uncharacterized protein n=1 Tax=Romanomermis culicivorax TaxID=13658 RepID=A0A915HGH1_ROMCU